MAVQSRVLLEPSAQGIVDATSTPPFLYELEPAAARKVLEDLQAAPIDKLPVEEEWITVPAEVGDARRATRSPTRRWTPRPTTRRRSRHGVAARPPIPAPRTQP
jgi:hypothetical protein